MKLASFDRRTTDRESEQSARTQKKPQGCDHRFGRSDVDTDPSWIAEGGMPNLAKLMKAGVSGSSVGSSANYSTGMDIVHDREKSR